MNPQSGKECKISMKKLIVLLIVLSTCFMIIYAYYTKSTYLPMIKLSELEQYNLAIEYDTSDYNQYFYYNDQMSYDDLMKESDLVVEITCLDSGEQMAYSTLRYCKIERILKGNQDLVNQNIYIYEPSYIMPYNTISITNGYINMYNNQQYVFFLKKVNAPQSTQSKYSQGYYPVSAEYGKYQLNHYEQKVDLKEGLLYNEIKDHEVLLTDDKEVTLYNQILKEIENNIN